jgi:hypothetical protein
MEPIDNNDVFSYHRPENAFWIYQKIFPDPSLPKRGNRFFPLWKRGMKGIFRIKIFLLLCADWPACRFLEKWKRDKCMELVVILTK